MTILQEHYTEVLEKTLPREAAGVFTESKPDRITPQDYVKYLESNIEEAALIEFARPDIPALADTARKDIARQLVKHYSPEAIPDIIDDYNAKALAAAKDNPEQPLHIITGVVEGDPFDAAAHLADRLIDDVLYSERVYEIATDRGITPREQLDSGEIVVRDFQRDLGGSAVQAAQKLAA